MPSWSMALPLPLTKKVKRMYAITAIQSLSDNFFKTSSLTVIMSIILKAKDQKAVKNATENIGHLVERITEQRHTASTMGLGIIAGGSFYGATDYFGEG